MTAIEYLQQKGLMRPLHNEFIIRFEDERQFNLVDLLEEYHKLKQKEIEDFTESDKSAWRPLTPKQEQA